MRIGALEEMKQQATKNQGFTLVELLVVVGILAVLGAVVFPTVQNALNKGREAAGLQNMRQLADALISYVSDTNAYPASETVLTSSGGGAGEELRQRWFNTLSPYIGVSDARAVTNAGGNDGLRNARGDSNQEVFNQVMIDPLVRGKWQIGENNSIGYNYQYLGNARPTGYFKDANFPPPGDYTASADATHTVPAGGRKGNGFVNFPVFSNEIEAPDKTIAFAYSDGTGHVTPYRSAIDQYANRSIGSGAAIAGATFQSSAPQALNLPGATMQGHEFTTIGNNGFQIDPTFLPLRNINLLNDSIPSVPDNATELEISPAAGSDGSDPAESFHSQAARSVVTNRYDGGTIVAYCDGHVQYLKREAVYIDPRTGRPSNRLWNGFGRDNDENGNGIIDATETVVDQNEWVGLDANGGVLVAALVDARVNPAGGESINGSFLQGGSDLLDPTAQPLRGGVNTAAVSTIFEEIVGPTLPKVRPFPIIVNVLGDTLVNTAPRAQ